ncbi:MAG TPA: hypothetical protein VF384_20315 [Planctomycetota bacterium]
MRATLLLVLCLPAFAVAQSQVTKTEAAQLKRQGFVLYEGRWRLPQEIVYLQEAAMRRFSTSAPAVPAAAKSPGADAPQLAASKDRPRRRGSTTTGLMTIRLQNVRVVGWDTVTVNLGTGSARLQLPRTEVVSIGTTVGVPLR